MSRLIDADALKSSVRKKFPNLADRIEKNGLINGQPTIEAEPVRHGHIEIKAINPYDGEDCYCSECGHGSLLPDFKWCPYCGAKMDDWEELRELREKEEGYETD